MYRAILNCNFMFSKIDKSKTYSVNELQNKTLAATWVFAKNLKSNKNMLLVFQSVLFISLALRWEQIQELGRRNGKKSHKYPIYIQSRLPSSNFDIQPHT